MTSRPLSFAFLIHTDTGLGIKRPRSGLQSAFCLRPRIRVQHLPVGQGLPSREVVSASSPGPKAQCNPQARPDWRPGGRVKVEVASNSPFPLSWL